MRRAVIGCAAVLVLFGSTAPALAQQQQAAQAAPVTGQTPRPEWPRPYAFSIALVLGDMQAASAPDNLSAAARKALADTKDFLPYKGYRLLDSQWSLCCGNAPLTGRLRGIDDQDYELVLDAGGPRDGGINIRFMLREVAGRTDSDEDERRARAADLEKRIESLQVEMVARREKSGATAPEIQKLKGQIDLLRRELAETRPSAFKRPGRGGGRVVIDASFRMATDETVVVGTSRLKGDNALIALLTAVPAKSTREPEPER